MLRLSFSLLGAVGFWGKAGFGAVLGGQFCFASPCRAAGKRSGNAVASSPHRPWGIGFGTHCPVRSCPSTLPGSQIISCSQPERRESSCCNAEKNQENPLCLALCSRFFPPSHPRAGCSPNPCPTMGLEFSLDAEIQVIPDFLRNPPQGRRSPAEQGMTASGVSFQTLNFISLFLNLIPSFLPSTPRGGSDSTSRYPGRILPLIWLRHQKEEEEKRPRFV